MKIIDLMELVATEQFCANYSSKSLTYIDSLFLIPAVRYILLVIPVFTNKETDTQGYRFYLNILIMIGLLTLNWLSNCIDNIHEHL